MHYKYNEYKITTFNMNDTLKLKINYYCKNNPVGEHRVHQQGRTDSGVDIQGEYGVYTPPVRKIHNFLCT